MGNERIDDDPIQMQPVLALKPKDVRDELDGGQPMTHDHGEGGASPAGHYDGGSPPKS
jgi:hypothetical protein